MSVSKQFPNLTFKIFQTFLKLLKYYLSNLKHIFVKMENPEFLFMYKRFLYFL